MSSDQLAVARAYQPPAAKRQGGIPQFLDKLYHMVEDPNTDLIRWSDSGDSFVVMDQEKFSKEVLGRWFKHQNFGSFVRQLNLYGFRKVPHLQQGALHADSTEPLCFENTNFHRGQPDLLQLISRKKQAVPGREDAATEKAVSGTGAARSLTAGGATMDVNNLLTGIAAIKRHQTTISTELTELKRSNQALWQEAIAARERYQRQQDTVERILKFLAGVFGQAPPGTSPVQDPQPNGQGGPGIPRQPKRLLIEAPQVSQPADPEVARFEEHNSPAWDQDDDMDDFDDPATPPGRRAEATLSSVSSPVTSRVTPFSTTAELPGDLKTPDMPLASSTTTPGVWNGASNGNYFNDPATSAMLSNSAQQDPTFNNFITNLLNKPNEFQKVMNAMQGLSPVATPADASPVNGGNLVLAQNNGYPASQQLALDNSAFANLWQPTSSLPPLDLHAPISDLSAPTSSNALIQPIPGQEHLQNLTDSTVNLDAQFEAVDTSLHSIMQTLGLPQDGYPTHFDGQDQSFGGPLDFDGVDNGHGFGDDGLDMDWKAILEQMDDSGMTSVIDPVVTSAPATVAPTAAPSRNGAVSNSLQGGTTVPAKRKAEDEMTGKAKRTTRKK